LSGGVIVNGGKQIADGVSVLGAISASGEIEGGSVTSATVSSSNTVSALTASIGTVPSVTTNIAGNPFYVHGNVSASGAVLASGVLDSNVTNNVALGAVDLTATAKNLVWYATGAQSGAISLPQATAANAGMEIKIIVGTTDWSATAFKLGFANGGSTVMTGYIRLGSNAGSEAVDGFVVTAGSKALLIDADDATSAGGAIGSIRRAFEPAVTTKPSTASDPAFEPNLIYPVITVEPPFANPNLKAVADQSVVPTMIFISIPAFAAVA
jgi:hypothetical protein